MIQSEGKCHQEETLHQRDAGRHFVIAQLVAARLDGAMMVGVFQVRRCVYGGRTEQQQTMIFASHGGGNRQPEDQQHDKLLSKEAAQLKPTLTISHHEPKIP
jgi:hypothetical protein